MRDDTLKEVKTFCRICTGGCGMRVAVGGDGRIAHIRPDEDHPMTKGYACLKGMQAKEAHESPARLRRPLKRNSDGSFSAIGLEQALDEIAARIRPYYDSGHKDAIALFTGNGGGLCSSGHGMQFSFMPSLGSKAHYTTVTIDQPAKIVSFERLGGWPAGMQGITDSDVALLFGANPLVSHACVGFLFADPARRLKAAKERGLKLIVVDPRRTDTGRHADLMLQPLPGQDPAIAGGMIRLILDEGWHDADFLARFATPAGIAAMRAAVDPFTENYVERRAGLKPGQLRQAAEMFARDAKRGAAHSATGSSMAPYNNLTQHLIDALNVICGRYRRAGDKITVDMLTPPYPIYEEAISPPRSWTGLPPGRIRGVGSLGGERLSATLADEILTPGDGQVRCLIVGGGNPMTSMPDTLRLREALKALDLLVVIDPYMTATAKYAHYILPPKMQYERADLPISLNGFTLFTDNWTQYTPPVIDPPPGSEVCDEWYPFWGLAKRLGFAIDYLGKGPLPMNKRPTTDELLAIRLKGARVSFDELKKFENGHVWDSEEFVVRPGRPGASGRFDLMPEDVAQEIRDFLAQPSVAELRLERRKFTHLLSPRRLRNAFCSNGTVLPTTRKVLPFNPAFLHPDDMRALGLARGDAIRISSDHGSVQAVVEPDETMRPGVVALSHGWGGDPVESDDDWDGAANVNLLIACDRNYESISALPRMSAIPVNLERVNARPARAS